MFAPVFSLGRTFIFRVTEFVLVRRMKGFCSTTMVMASRNQRSTVKFGSSTRTTRSTFRCRCTIYKAGWACRRSTFTTARTPVSSWKVFCSLPILTRKSTRYEDTPRNNQRSLNQSINHWITWECADFEAKRGGADFEPHPRTFWAKKW